MRRSSAHAEFERSEIFHNAATKELLSLKMTACRQSLRARPSNPPLSPAVRLVSQFCAPMFKHDKLNFIIFSILVGLQILGLAAIVTEFEWRYLPVMFAVYLWGGLSTTLYLHRYLTHR